MKKNKNIVPLNDFNKPINFLDKKFISTHYSELISTVSKNIIDATNKTHQEIYKMYTPYLMNAINISSKSIIKLIENMSSHYLFGPTIDSMSNIGIEIINNLNQTVLNSFSNTIIEFGNVIGKMNTNSLNFISNIIEGFDFENVEIHDNYLKYKKEKITVNDINLTINNVNNSSIKIKEKEKRNNFIVGIIIWIVVTFFSGIVSKPGSDLYDIIINNNVNNEINKASDSGFNNNLKYNLVIKDELDVKAGPNSNAKNIRKINHPALKVQGL